MFKFNREIESDDFWAQSGLYLLWNRFFPRFSLEVTLSPWFICECDASMALDGIQVRVVSVVFTPNTTVLELELTALDESEEMVKINPWNTTVELRKCVNKNLRVSQIEKVSSVDLHPEESRRVYTAYRAVKLSSRLRWIDIFVSIGRGQGQFVEDTLRIPYETLMDSSSKKTVSELENIMPQFVNIGLLFLYGLSFFLLILINAPLKYFELAWYYNLFSHIAVALACAVFLKWQFIKALVNIGCQYRPSIRSLYSGPHSLFDPATRSKGKQKQVSSRVFDHLRDKEA